MTEWILVIDTDSYAGNFEREMCAYSTGVIGECEVGDREAETFKDEVQLDFEDIILQRSDDNGFFRPCSIWETPGRLNNGMGGIYNEGEEPPKVDLDKMYPDGVPDHMKNAGNGAFPAYESVGIFFHDKPSDDVIECIKSRSQEYASMKGIVVNNFRLVSETTVTETIEILV